LAALDQVALRDAEDEVAGGRLHLTAAEGDRVEPALELADQLLGRGVPWREMRVGHARDREVAERLAPAVPGRPGAVLARGQQVVEVRREPALVDDGRAARRRALVV